MAVSEKSVPLPGDADVSDLLAAATRAHEEGRLDEAQAAYGALLVRDPNCPEAEHGLAWLLVQRGDWKAALPRFARALKLRPWEREFWISQLEALLQVGQHEAVHRLLHRAAQSGLPADVVAGFEARLARARLDLLTAKVRASGKTAKQAAEAPKAALLRLRETFLRRDFAAARAEATALVASYPLCAFAWRVLSASHPPDSRDDDALQTLRIACDLDPENVDLLLNLALVLQEARRHDEAQALNERALALQPENVRALVNTGVLLSQQGDERAEDLLRKALALGADDPRVALALGSYLRDRHRYDEAEPLLESVLAADPTNQHAIAALSVCYLGLGRHDEAAELFKRAQADTTMGPDALGILLFVAAHMADVVPEELFAMHRRYGELLERSVEPSTYWPNTRDAERRLRLGFVSGDFRDHPIAKFLLPLWRGLDREHFEIFAYSNHSTVDETTLQLRALCDRWLEVRAMSDDAVAERVRRDGIDVLIDLSGHTAFHRLGVFAHRPAPVQISSYGYPATTGLQRMDYYLADAIFAPPGRMDAQFTEKLMLGSANATFQPPENAPAPAPLPSLGGAPFTFGSFNRMSKVTPRTVQLWAAALRATPHARLLIGAADGVGEVRLRAQFADHGIEGARLEFLPRTGVAAYLAAHARVDLLLDTSPYAGGTTTCLGLWMGVPTLTVPGSTLPSRAGAAILERVGLREFIAEGSADFVARAVAFASPASQTRLASLRDSLREHVQASNLCSPTAATESFEDGVRMAWRQWCRGLPPMPIIVPPRHD